MAQMMPAGRSIPPSATPFRMLSVYRLDPTCHAASMRRGQEPGARSLLPAWRSSPIATDHRLAMLMIELRRTVIRDRWRLFERRGEAKRLE